MLLVIILGFIICSLIMLINVLSLLDNNDLYIIICYDKKCNKTFEIFPYNFKQGHGCPYCNGNKSKQIKAKNDFIDKFNKIGNNEYELLSEYISSREYIEIKHKGCTFLIGY